MNKEEWILAQIENTEKMREVSSYMKKDAQKLVNDYIDAKIEHYKNISDEDYEKALKIEEERKEIKEPYVEDDPEILSKLDELGMTLEELDAMSMEEAENYKINRK